MTGLLRKSIPPTVEALGCRIEASTAESGKVGEKVTLLIRPEDIVLLPVSKTPTPSMEIESNTVAGEIRVSTFSGSSTYLEVAVGEHILRVSIFGVTRFDFTNAAGQAVRLHFDRCSVIRASR